jgi:hypothetical protein
VVAVTATPAGTLGRADKGGLVPGGDADIVLLDTRLDVVVTIVAGEIAFCRPGGPAPAPSVAGGERAPGGDLPRAGSPPAPAAP